MADLHSHCFIYLFFWLHHAARGILVPQPGIEPMPPELGAWSLNHWTTREVPEMNWISKEVVWKLIKGNLTKQESEGQRGSSQVQTTGHPYRSQGKRWILSLLQEGTLLYHQQEEESASLPKGSPANQRP